MRELGSVNTTFRSDRNTTKAKQNTEQECVLTKLIYSSSELSVPVKIMETA